MDCCALHHPHKVVTHGSQEDYAVSTEAQLYQTLEFDIEASPYLKCLRKVSEAVSASAICCTLPAVCQAQDRQASKGVRRLFRGMIVLTGVLKRSCT